MKANALSRRTLLRSTLLGGGAVVVGGGVLAACGDDDEQTASGGGSGTTAVTLQVSWTHSVQFGGTYLALDRGYWTEEGLDVSLGAGGPNVAGDAQTVSGRALMNVSFAQGVAQSNAEGADLKIIGAAYQKNPSAILSLASNPIETPQDLLGARLGVTAGDTPALEAFAVMNDLPYDDIIKVPTQYDPSPLVDGQVDALYCFANDLPVSLTVAGHQGYTMLLGDFGFTAMSQTYTVRSDSLTGDKREQLVKLLRGEIRGWQDYQADPQAAADLTLEMFPDAGLDAEVQSEMAQVQLGLMYGPVTDANGFAWFTDEQVAETIEVLGRMDVAAETSLWDRSILEEIFDGEATV